ncbi:hypothetical protein CYMTET_54522 [Cymbomonas tetramitiformis]|uniref:Uncharacterized protein n=1 Tax=Cymbomonas tetramitiformis TaxID=36881 RepID=A0AAE0BGJ7_9CHLO|nr:hypothetical protein CYMTET_54522 [Cymbomonas tetramitiformis]
MTFPCFQEHHLTPVAKFPSSHPKSSSSYCGTETYIPEHTSFPKGSSGSSCTRTRGAEAYYSWNVPGATSANTGYEEKDTLLLYFIVDQANDIYFVLVADALEADGDTDGGQLSLEIDVTPVSAAANIRLVSADDRCAGCGCVDALAMSGNTWVDSAGGDCASYAQNDYCANGAESSGWDWWWGRFHDYADSYGTDASGACCVCGGGETGSWPSTSWDSCQGYSHSLYEDCYAFEQSEGKGTFAWKYPSCCTDGMSLGPLPIDDFCLTMYIETTTGLSKVKLASWVETSNTISTTEVGMDDVRNNGLQVATLQCCPPDVRHPSI